MITPNELLFVVDENNNPLAAKARNVVHAEGDWHRTAIIWVVNDRKEVLCQKRSMRKDSSPGKWEAFFGGHMAPGTAYTDVAQIELAEEIGLRVEKELLHFIDVFRSEANHEFQGVQYVQWSGDVSELTLEKDEIDEVAWVPFIALKKLLLDDIHPDWVHMEYEAKILETVAAL